jgi:hypothetical protein
VSGGAERLRADLAAIAPWPWTVIGLDVRSAENDHLLLFGPNATTQDAVLAALAPELAALVADMAEALEKARTALRDVNQLIAEGDYAEAHRRTFDGAFLAHGVMRRLDALLPEREPA